MLEIKNKSVATPISNGSNHFLKLELKPDQFDDLVQRLIKLVPDHYIDPNVIARTLEKLGKPHAAEKLRIKIPETKKTRSGDIGEVMATDFIEEETGYTVPIRKLRWRDHRNMSMRGDDVIGIIVNPQNQTLRFLKAEAKGNKTLGRAVLAEAQKELDSDHGRPTPHALSFIADRLIELGNTELSDLIEKASLDSGISQNQVQHLLFTVTQSDPIRLQKEAFDNYRGTIAHQSVGVRVGGHQELIKSVYQGILDGLDD